MWRDAGKRAQAAAALKITSEDVSRLGCVDDVVPEPPGGAQNDTTAAAALLDEKLVCHFNQLKAMTVEDLVARRLAKFREIARFYKDA
jgi:acetyl-CoA carboxylase carboxyl transferase subunit alpha